MTPRRAKPAILASIPRDRHVVVEASAGTGKTFTLEHLLVDLLLRTDLQIEQILVVTFTEKATAELKSRVRRKLEELLAWDGDAPGVPDEGCWVLDEPARTRLVRALGSLDAATISTIHAFCQRVLVENAFAHRRLFGETRVDGGEAFSAAFREALRRDLARDPARSAWLRAWLRRGGDVDGLERLLLDCARERGELRPSFDAAALDAAIDAVPINTGLRDGFAAELRAAKMHGGTAKAVTQRLGVLWNLLGTLRTLASPAERLSALDGWRAQDGDTIAWLLQRLDALPTGLPLVADVRRALRALGAAAVPFEAALVQALLPPVRDRLRDRKRDRGLFDFDDMLSLVHESLRGEGGDELVETLRERYRYALIDEFQDTDETQWEIFRRIFFESPGPHRLCLVGDPKQSIYRFRGADVQTYLRAREEIRAAGGEQAVVALRENFRSTAPVVEACNRVFDPEAQPPFFDGDCRYEHPVTCGRPERRATAGRGGEPVAPVVLLRVPGTGPVPAAAAHAGLDAAIAAEIRALLDPARPGLWLDDDDGPRRVGARDIFVLTRTTGEGLRIGEALRAAGLPHAFYKQEGLFQTEEAAHVLDLLAAVQDPHDPRRRLRAWLTPFFELGAADLAAVRELPGSHPLLSRLLDWNALADARDYERLFAHILDDSGLVRREVFEKDTERSLTNYLHLFEILLEEAGRSRPPVGEVVVTLRAFIEGRRLPAGEDGNTQRLESERDAVQIMTMHKSKGLEAAVVFVAGGLTRSGPPDRLHVCHENGRRVAYVGRTPDASVQARCDAESAEEERRLLYVALTRAKARLYLPYFGPAPGKPPAAELKLAGCYLPVHERLVRLVADPDPAVRALYHVRDAEPAPAPAPGAAAPPLAPPPQALVRPAPEEGLFAGLRARHAGFVVTSYSKLAALEDAGREPEPEDFSAEPPGAPRPAGDDELPGGTATGVYLHELLELLPIGPFLRGLRFDDWAARGDVRRVLADVARRHGIEERYRAAAARMVHAAIAGPVQAGRRIGAIGACDRVLRELEFLYPIPEADHPRLGQAASEAGFVVRRGFVKGFVDVVFEDGGAVFLGDWKSDHLDDFGADALAAHVRLHYGTQIRLYSLALVRMLGLGTEADFERRFGGIVYCFLRAMDAGGDGRAGVHFERPSWRDLVAWERELVERDYGRSRGEVSP